MGGLIAYAGQIMKLALKRGRQLGGENLGQGVDAGSFALGALTQQGFDPARGDDDLSDHGGAVAGGWSNDGIRNGIHAWASWPPAAGRSRLWAAKLKQLSRLTIR
ncbi:hypothetical protein SDC9_139992 [bioreactor metagenome]|uniref:Uncharacterized protein n=1 Tax=bioreactor metagenome TaxID=1076179 RepID=A0A645DU41_9ZZZZ